MEKGLITVLYLLISVPLAAQTTINTSQPNSLLSFYQAALAYNARFNAAILNHQSMQDKIPIARSRLLPGISLYANVGYTVQQARYHDEVSFFDSSKQRFSSNEIGIELTQPLYRKERFEAYKQAKVEGSQASIQLLIIKQQLILNVSRGYFDVLLAQEGVKLAEVEKAENNKLLVRARRGFDVGSAAITDVHEANARFDLSVSHEIDSHKSLQVARRRLTKFTGITFTLISRPHEPIALIKLKAMAWWVEQALKANLAIQIAEKHLLFTGLEIERIRGLASPKLDLVVSYNNASADNSVFGTGIDTANTRVMLEAHIPLYSGGAVSATLRQKRTERRSAQLGLEATQRDITFQVEEAYLAYESGRHRIKALEQAIHSSQASLRSTQRGVELGLRTGIDLLDAQHQLYAVKQVLAETRYQYLFDRLRLKALTGGLTVEDIQEIDVALH